MTERFTGNCWDAQAELGYLVAFDRPILKDPKQENPSPTKPVIRRPKDEQVKKHVTKSGRK